MKTNAAEPKRTSTDEMAVSPSVEPAFRASDFVAKFNRRYPKAWRMADEARMLSSTKDAIAHGELGFLPLETWAQIAFRVGAPTYEATSNDPGQSLDEDRHQFRRTDLARDVIPLAAAGTWSKEKVICRFDPTVSEELIRTPTAGNLPCEWLTRLPHWAVYIDTSGMCNIDGNRIFGAFVFPIRESVTGPVRWVFVLDQDEKEPDFGALPLGPWSLAHAFEQATTESGLSQHHELAEHLTAFRCKVVEPLMSLYLYLCSKAPDLVGDSVDNFERPRPVKTKRGLRYFGPEQPRTWQVGVRIGAAIRDARLRPKLDTTADARPHASPRGHVRCAHWHHYWVGPRNSDDKRAELRWIHPTLVNAEDPNLLPTVVRPVKAANDD